MSQNAFPRARKKDEALAELDQVVGQGSKNQWAKADLLYELKTEHGCSYRELTERIGADKISFTQEMVETARAFPPGTHQRAGFNLHNVVRKASANLMRDVRAARMSIALPSPAEALQQVVEGRDESGKPIKRSLKHVENYLARICKVPAEVLGGGSARRHEAGASASVGNQKPEQQRRGGYIYAWIKPPTAIETQGMADPQPTVVVIAKTEKQAARLVNMDVTSNNYKRDFRHQFIQVRIKSGVYNLFVLPPTRRGLGG